MGLSEIRCRLEFSQQLAQWWRAPRNKTPWRDLGWQPKFKIRWRPRRFEESPILGPNSESQLDQVAYCTSEIVLTIWVMVLLAVQV